MQPNKRFRFLPSENYTVLTTLSEEEVLERLHIITRTTDTIRFSARKAIILRTNYDYNGEIHGKSFEIWRNISYRNSFLPVITGNVTQQAEKTEIRISMKLSLVVKILSFCFGGFGIGVLVFSMYLNALFSGKSLNPFFFVLIPVAAFLLGYLIVLLAFRLEARISKKDLNSIFKAEPNQSV